MQVVIRDSGRQQPRDVGWLGAEQRWTVGSLATAATFVSSGLGFAWLPRHMIERELKEGTLKLLPLDQGGSRHPSSTCIRTRTNPGPGHADPHRTAAHLRHRAAGRALRRPRTSLTRSAPMAYFEHEGCNLHYEEYGHGTPLLLVHGLGSSTRTGKCRSRRCPPHYRVIVPDIRGHGRSDKPRERYSIAGFSADLLALIEHLNLGPTHYVGLSMGGMIGFPVAVDQPQLLKACASSTARPKSNCAAATITGSGSSAGA
jgi:hypothetical protein